jgi:hypothetical protein
LDIIAPFLKFFVIDDEQASSCEENSKTSLSSAFTSDDESNEDIEVEEPKFEKDFVNKKRMRKNRK